jgi:hypothetical protein
MTRAELSLVRGVVRREETTLRLGGVGDNWHMSWAADDRQLVSLCDGFGWDAPPAPFYSSRVLAITGEPENAGFDDIPAYPDLSYDVRRPDTWNRYYGFGILALDNSIYHFLSTPTVAFDLVDAVEPRFVGAKLIYSADNGRTWSNQDGSSPVDWEAWSERSKENMVFFEEPQEAFSLLTVLQMGRNYEANTDGYVYVYAPNGNTDGTMNELVMFRVPKDRILDRSAYQYFASRSPDGRAIWTKEIGGRGVVHVFPSGWVNTALHPYAWQPSVAYNEALGIYMMASWGMGCAPDGTWFGKPSYLGLWAAVNPWGPWVQFHEETAWVPAGDSAARAYQPQIAPKWIAKDGKSFWLVWTEYEDASAEDALDVLESVDAPHERTAMLESLGSSMPYYGFNAQRVDLRV